MMFSETKNRVSNKYFGSEKEVVLSTIEELNERGFINVRREVPLRDIFNSNGHDCCIPNWKVDITAKRKNGDVVLIECKNGKDGVRRAMGQAACYNSMGNETWIVTDSFCPFVIERLKYDVHVYYIDSGSFTNIYSPGSNESKIDQMENGLSDAMHSKIEREKMIHRERDRNDDLVRQNSTLRQNNEDLKQNIDGLKNEISKRENKINSFNDCMVQMLKEMGKNPVRENGFDDRIKRIKHEMLRLAELEDEMGSYGYRGKIIDLKRRNKMLKKENRELRIKIDEALDMKEILSAH